MSLPCGATTKKGTPCSKQRRKNSNSYHLHNLKLGLLGVISNGQGVVKNLEKAVGW